MRRLSRREFAAALTWIGCFLWLPKSLRAQYYSDDYYYDDEPDWVELIEPSAQESDDGDDSSTLDDLLNEATGDRTEASSDLVAACSDPTGHLGNPEWAGFLQSDAEAKSYLKNDADGIAADVDKATAANDSGFWDAQWFNVHHTEFRMTSPEGILSVDPELGNGAVTLPLPFGPEGGVYLSGSDQGLAVGAYVGLPTGLETSLQMSESGGVPSVDFAVREGPAELSIGVDLGPMIEAGGRAFENFVGNLFEYVKLSEDGVGF